MLEINVAVALNKRMMTVYCKTSFDISKLLKVERAKIEKKKKEFQYRFSWTSIHVRNQIRFNQTET